MKQKRFRKVVEWGEKVNLFYISAGVVGIVSFLFGYFDNEIGMITSLGILFCLFLIIEGLPKYRRVHWEEIK